MPCCWSRPGVSMHWPLPRALVSDEAHNLEDACTSSLTDEVSYFGLRALFNRLHVPNNRTGLLLRLRRNLSHDARVQATARHLLIPHCLCCAMATPIWGVTSRPTLSAVVWPCIPAMVQVCG